MIHKLLPTPRTSDTNGPGKHGDGGLDLRTAVTLLPTPTVQQGRNATSGRQPDAVFNTGTTLNDAIWELSGKVPLLPTPLSRDHKDGPPNPNIPTNSFLGREIWKLVSDDGHQQSPDGNTSSDDQPQTHTSSND